MEVIDVTPAVTKQVSISAEAGTRQTHRILKEKSKTCQRLVDLMMHNVHHEAVQ